MFLSTQTNRAQNGYAKHNEDTTFNADNLLEFELDFTTLFSS